MFSKYNPTSTIELHNALIAERTGLRPQLIQKFNDEGHPFYFHLCRLQEYLANYFVSKHPALSINELILIAKQTEGCQILLNLHTGYHLIKTHQASIEEVKSWSEDYRKTREQLGCMIESIVYKDDKNHLINSNLYTCRR